MKKTIIISTIIVVIALALAVVFYISSFHRVTLTVKSPDLSGMITHIDATGATTKAVTTFPLAKPLALQNGSYAIIPKGSVYDTTPIIFQVAGHDTTVTVDPGYSTAHLAALLQNELPALSSLIQSTYSTRLAAYHVSTGALYQKGEWYGTTIVGNAMPDGSFGDTYHIVLHKVGGSWGIATTPEIVLTTHDYPNIPRSILTAVNSL